MAFVAGASASPQTTIITLQIPNTASEGDIAIIQIGASSASVSPVPAPWVVAADTIVANMRCLVIFKQLTSSDPGSTFSFDTGVSLGKCHISIVVISDMDFPAAEAISPLSDTTTKSVYASPAVSNSVARMAVGGFMTRTNNTLTNITKPASFTDAAESYGTGTACFAGAMAYRDIASTNIPAETWVLTADGLRGYSWVLLFGQAAGRLDTPIVVLSFEEPDSGNNGSISASWTAISGADYYSVEIAPGLDATSGFTMLNPNLEGTTYLIPNLGPGDYTVGVIAYPGG